MNIDRSRYEQLLSIHIIYCKYQFQCWYHFLILRFYILLIGISQNRRIYSIFTFIYHHKMRAHETFLSWPQEHWPKLENVAKGFHEQIFFCQHESHVAKCYIVWFYVPREKYQCWIVYLNNQRNIHIIEIEVMNWINKI